MPALFLRAEDAVSDASVNPIKPVVIAICVLSALAGICAVAVCAHYVWSSESRHLRTVRSAKSILDDALMRSISTSKPDDKPPPYSFNADFRPVSMIPPRSS